jgi:uncharacterized protein involved in response to NO
MATIQQARTARPRAAVAREDRTFPWYIAAALMIAVGGGFALAIALPLAAAQGWDWGVRWRALAQAHGHLQISGWVGLFIAGMAFRLAPRFAGRPLRGAAVTGPALALLLLGVLGRTLAQPWLDAPGMPVLLRISACAELLGALFVTTALSLTLAPSVSRLPSAPWLLLGATGLIAQAALSVIWLWNLPASAPALPADRNDALLALQFFAFLLPFVLGVALRALPTFSGRPAPSPRRSVALAATYAVGAALHALGGLTMNGAVGARVEAVGALLLVAAVAAVLLHLGVWRAPERLRPPARPATLLVRSAFAWLALAMAGLAVAAISTLADGRPLQPERADALRHMLALGVFTTLIPGMAYLMLPWLAMRRAGAARLRREIRTLWLLLTAATVLRVLGALLIETGTDRFHLMAAGGVLGIAAVVFFAVMLLRAAHHPPPEIVLHEKAPR